MRRVLVTVTLVVMILASLQQPAGAYIAPYAAAAPAPLRAGPSADSQQLGVAYPGGDFEVVETSADGWTAVQIGGEKYWLAPGALAPVQQPPQAKTATVTASVLNVRKGAGTQHAVITTVKKGQQLPVLEQGDGWVKVAVGAASGWVSATYVRISAQATATRLPTVSFEKQAVVNVSKANVRTGTNTGYDVKGQASKGTVLPVYSTAGGWMQVVYRNDLGWVEGSLLTITDKGRTNPGVVYSVSENNWQIRFPVFGTVTGSTVNLRTGAGTNYKSIGTVKRGARLELKGTQGNWARVDYEGQECFISRDYFKADSNAQARSISFVMDGLTKRLTFTNMGQISVGKTDDGLALLFQLPVKLPQAHLDISTGEFKSLLVDGDVAALTLAQRPSYSIETAGADTSISFTTKLTAITWKQAADRDSITFTAAGSLPASLLSAQPLSLKLGATSDITALPGPLAGAVAAMTGGVRIDFAGQQAASVLRHAPGQITIELLKPGLRGRTIVIDPGHGGRDPGALGLVGTKEKDINLAIALLLRDKLKAAGADVVMTRDTDTSLVPPEEAEEIDYARQVSISELARRSNLAADRRGDMFISIHNNSMGYKSDQSGTETYYYSGASNAASAKRLAGLAQRELVAALGLRDRGVKDEQFYVIKNADAPAILVEGAFLSNTNDEQMLLDPLVRERMAEALFRAISEYFGPDAGGSLQ
ncbi:MAG: N-acetylmuramoyl-L-alanine amidase [Chloroflexota bacterium]